MKASELKGRAIVSLDRAEKIGTVDDVILDIGASQVQEFTMHTGLLGGSKHIPARSVRSVGADAITIADSSAVQDLGLKASDSVQLASLNGLLGSKIVSEEGSLLGTLGDVILDATGLQIQCYEMSGNLWDRLTGSAKTFDAAPGIRMGRQLIVVPDAIAAALRGRSDAGTEPPPAADDANS